MEYPDLSTFVDRSRRPNRPPPGRRRAVLGSIGCHVRGAASNGRSCSLVLVLIASDRNVLDAAMHHASHDAQKRIVVISVANIHVDASAGRERSPHVGLECGWADTEQIDVVGGAADTVGSLAAAPMSAKEFCSGPGP